MPSYSYTKSTVSSLYAQRRSEEDCLINIDNDFALKKAITQAIRQANTDNQSPVLRLFVMRIPHKVF